MTKTNPLSSPARFESPRKYQTREFISDSIQAIRRTRQNTLIPTLPDVLERTTVVTCFNTGTACDQYEPLMIRGCYPANGTNAFWATNEIALEASKALAASDVNCLVLPMQPIGANEAGLVAVSGIVACPVYFSASNETWIRRADMLAGQNRLVAAPNGSVEILYVDPTGLGGTLPAEVDCVVRLAPAVDVTYQAVAVGDIPADGSGAASIYQNNADTTYSVSPVFLDHMEGDLDVSSGKELKITWYHAERRWAVDGAECEDPPTPPMTFRGEWDPNF